MNLRRITFVAMAAAALVMVGVGPASADYIAGNGIATNSWNQASKNYYMNHAGDDLAFTLVFPFSSEVLMKWVKCSDSSVQGQPIKVLASNGPPTIIGRNFAAGTCVRLAYKRVTTGPDTRFSGWVDWNTNLG